MKNRIQHFSPRTERLHFRNFLLCLVLFLAYLKVAVSDSDEEETFSKAQCEAALPECQCDDYGGVIGLICQNVSNFEAFTATLSDESLFEVYTAFEIGLSGSRVLPREFLRGLITFRLYIADVNTEIVEEGAFDGTYRLRRFNVMLSSINEIPDFRPVAGSLRNLNLDNSLITSISGDGLKNLSSLETISFVNNSIQSVSSDAFQGTDNLHIFDLSYNQLRSLPPNLFSSWQKLKKVVLSFNQLLHVDQLFAVTHPTFVYLEHNNLTDLDSILYPNMTEVERLILSHNPLSKITENSFNGKVNNVRFLYLDHCLIPEFNASHFQDLSRLRRLDLSYNLIENVSHQRSQFGLVPELDFTGNVITEFNVNFRNSTKYVYLSKNLLTSVGQFLQYSQIMGVSMVENRIESLGPEVFLGVRGLEIIELQDNLISQVDPLTFKNTRTRDLVYLDLSRNQIRSLRGSVRNLHWLSTLKLTGNMIEDFEEGEFHRLPSLEVLHLEDNRIKSLGKEMRGLSSLKHLFLKNNRISTLKPEQIPQILNYLYFEGNPIKCDCQLLPLLQYLNSSSVITDAPLCTPSNQTSLLPPTECPDGCNCSCTLDNDDHFVSVDCSSAGLTELPRLFTDVCSSTAEENCTTMAIQLPRNNQFSPTTPFVIEDDIGGLNLNDSNLRSLEGAQLPGRLRHLLLGNNHLQRLPMSQLHNLEKLSKVELSGNPWSCDCESLSFKEWIFLKSEITIDANDTRCGPQSPGLYGRVIGSLTDMDLCPDNTGFSTSPVI